MLIMIIMMILSLTVNCPALPIPSYPLLIDASSGFNEGAAIVYSCAPGYKLNGDRQRNCVNRIWSGREPTCTGKCIYTQRVIMQSCLKGLLLMFHYYATLARNELCLSSGRSRTVPRVPWNPPFLSRSCI